MKNQGWKRFLSSPGKIAVAIAGVFFVLALVERFTGATDITSSGASGATLRFAIPILLAGLGGLWSERAGVINIGLEGMMIVGTWMGAWFGFLYGPWTGLLFAAIGGALTGLLHAILTVKIGIDQAVSGLAINLLAAGATRYFSGIYFVANGGDISVSPLVQQPGTFSVPGVSEFLGGIEGHDTFFVSSVAGVLGGLVTNASWMTLLALLCVPLTWWILWKTGFGLRVRFSGENPVAAESLGVNVYRVRYIAISISGMLAALGGAYLSLVASAVYREGQTGGRGFIGLATVIFGNWRPGGVFSGSLLFGFTDALRVRQAESVHAVLAVVAIVALLFAIYLFAVRRRKGAVVSAVIGLIAGIVFLQVKVIPDEFVTFFPNLVTLLVLVFMARRLRPPAMAGAKYRKGEEISE